MRDFGVLPDVQTPPRSEDDRIAALERFHILGSEPERSYDDIVQLASFICGTPIALISLVGRDTQWFKAKVGLDVDETPRSVSFCKHMIDTAETMVVNDTAVDARFQDNPLVTGDPNIRFYAGAPIVEKGGHVLGTVCAIDTVPRVLDYRQISALEALARQVVVLLEQREAVRTLEKAADDSQITDQQLKNSELRLQTFVDRIPALAWMADREGWIFWYNRRWYEYTGTNPDQMTGWGWQSVHDPATLPAVLEKWSATIRTGDPFEMVFPLKGADGEFRPFLTRVEPWRDSNGQVAQWFGTNVEVDALQKTKLALEKSQENLAQVLTATTDAVVSVDRDWVLTYLNPKAEKLFGASEQLVGHNVWEAFPVTAYEGSPFVEHCLLAMNEGVASTFEAEYWEPVPYTLGIEVYPSKDGIVVFSRDITKLKHATAAVLQNEKLAAVGRLASSIAHEINNPLEAVTNLLYLANTSEDLEEARPYLRNADIELRRASVITQQTLRFHRQATRPTQVTFAELVKGILTGQHSRLANSGAEVEERNRASRPVLCMEGEVRQVLSNLVSNAIDAMSGGGGTLYIRGRDGQDWKSGEPGMVMTIADTGIGMSETTRTKVFEAFYTTKGVGGSGLGLWISKEIIDRHRGHLRIRSKQFGSRTGTVIALFLPAEALTEKEI